jgi:hypothetical protein
MIIMKSFYRSFWVLLLISFGIQLNCSWWKHDELSPEPRKATTGLLKPWLDLGLRPFTIGPLGFYKNSLFAASDRGLFEAKEGRFVARYNWLNSNDVIEELYYDRTNDLLWLRHATIGKLVRFNGDKWSFVDLPQAVELRGSMLTGFQMFNSNSELYIYSENDIWRWDNSASKWRAVILPPTNCTGQRPGEPPECFVAAGALGDNTVFAVIRRGTISRSASVLPENPDINTSDFVVYNRKNSWITVPNTPNKYFFSKSVLSGNDEIFVLSTKNELFSITQDGIKQIPSIGEIDAIQTTSKGNLLVSVRNDGIFEFDNAWIKQADVHLTLREPLRIVHLAEMDGQISFSVSNTSDPIIQECNTGLKTSLFIIDSAGTQCISEK